MITKYILEPLVCLLVFGWLGYFAWWIYPPPLWLVYYFSIFVLMMLIGLTKSDALRAFCQLVYFILVLSLMIAYGSITWNAIIIMLHVQCSEAFGKW